MCFALRAQSHVALLTEETSRLKQRATEAAEQGEREAQARQALEQQLATLQVRLTGLRSPSAARGKDEERTKERKGTPA